MTIADIKASAVTIPPEPPWRSWRCRCGHYPLPTDLPSRPIANILEPKCQGQLAPPTARHFFTFRAVEYAVQYALARCKLEP